jgi:rubrerythrin
MNLKELLEKIVRQENELYNLYKLGETFATYERPEFVETFMIIAEEELKHKRIMEDILRKGLFERTGVVDYLEVLSIEPMVEDQRSKPSSLEELIEEAIIREKHAYEFYTRLSKILEGPLAEIMRMIAGEELKHAYRLRLIYEGL